MSINETPKKKIHIHSEGMKVALLDSEQKPTGYSVQLARLTRPSSKTEVLKLSVVNDATDENEAYAWTNPENTRLGINLLWMRVGLTREAKTPHIGFDTPTPVKVKPKTATKSDKKDEANTPSAPTLKNKE